MSCRFASDCPNHGTTLVRIAGVGDRRVCDEHHRWMTAVGMDFRVLPTTTFVPVWRQRGLGRDESGRLAS